MDSRNAWSEVWDGENEVVEEGWGEEEEADNLRIRNIFGLENYNENRA